MAAPPSPGHSPARATEVRFRGEAAVRLEAGALSTTFVPGVGLTGVSLRYRGGEYLALPGGLPQLRSGGTSGLPLLAPWANRLAAWRYRAAGVTVDLEGEPLPVDGNGLPIHGLLVGASGWRVDRLRTRRDTARLDASIDVDATAFPFPHRIDVAVTAGDGVLTIRTTVTPTGRRRVPVSFGWHPYLRLPGAARRRWRLRLPVRQHLVLDASGIPTGERTAEPAEADALEQRTFDDLYALGRGRRLAFDSDNGRSVELRCGAGYPYAQVWVPAGRTFAALEPMVAPTNALITGGAPVVSPGDSYSAEYTLALG